MKTVERPWRSRTAVEEEYLSRSILLEEVGSPRLARMVIAFSALSIAAFVAWSAFARVDEVAIATGKIIPSGEVFLVQHREGGAVTSLPVQEGMHVD